MLSNGEYKRHIPALEKAVRKNPEVNLKAKSGNLTLVIEIRMYQNGTT
jgi:hypothetical protein